MQDWANLPANRKTNFRDGQFVFEWGSEEHLEGF